MSKATAALAAKDDTNWHLYMDQIGTMAGSAQNPTVRRIAEEVHMVVTAPTTTTTTVRPKVSSKSKSKVSGELPSPQA